jgi:hypothetical protein
MQQQNERGRGQDSPGDELDRLLDAALQQYAAVQPREGLEGRILARLRSQTAEGASHAWWRWVTAAAAVAALTVIITMESRPHPVPLPNVAQHPSVSLPPPTLPRTSEPTPEIKRAKHRWHAASDIQVAKAPPKLDQFPSPQPLSEQEKLLASYVEVYPKQAALLAKLRTEELERERIEQQSKSPSKDAADFDKE